MTQNIIFKGDSGRNNPIRLNVGLGDSNLLLLDDISVTAGSDVRTLLLNPESIVIESANILALYFYDTTEINDGHFIIHGFNAENPFGVIITNVCKGNLSRYKICE